MGLTAASRVFESVDVSPKDTSRYRHRANFFHSYCRAPDAIIEAQPYVFMKQSHIAIIGAPMDLGAGRRGVDMGPSALRLANLNEKLASLGYEVEDQGNVIVDQPETSPVGPPNARYLSQIAATCTRLAEIVEKSAAQGRVPLVLGGDHSVAIGTVAGMSGFFRKRGKKLGLIWIDAH